MSPPASGALSRILAYATNAILLVWIVQGLAFMAMGLMVRAGRVTPDAADAALVRWGTPMVLAQATGGALLIVVGLWRHALGAEALSSPRHAWLSALMFLVLTGSTFYLAFSGVRVFETISRKDVVAPVRRFSGYLSDDDRTWRVVDEMPNTRVHYQDLRAVNVELGVLVSAQTFSAIGLLVLNLLGARRERGGPRDRSRGRRVPPWRVPRGQVRA